MLDSTRDTYQRKLEAMTLHALLKETENQIWRSAFANRNPRAEVHWKVDLCSAEARRRGDVKLYETAYRLALVNSGNADPYPEQGNLFAAEAKYKEASA